MVGKLNVTKNQYTKSITIPPMVIPETTSPESIQQGVTSQTQTKVEPVAPQPTTPIKTSNIENKIAPSKLKDESLIIENKVEVDFPSVSFDNSNFEESEMDSPSHNVVLPTQPQPNNSEYSYISGVKQRAVHEFKGGETTHTSNLNEGVSTSISNKDSEQALLSGLSSNSGINIIVRGDNATITVSNKDGKESVSISQGETLPTLQDIKSANTLEDILVIEEKYSETLGYLNAKKLVLEMERKIK